MSDPEPDMRPTGPYRRQPPTIDAKTGDYRTITGEATPSADPTPSDAWTPISDEPLPPKDHAETPTASPEPGTGDRVPEHVLDGTIAVPNETAGPALHEEAAGATGGVNAGASVPPVSGAADRAETPPPRRGVGSLLAASLIGGVVGAALAIGADTYMNGGESDVGARLAAIEARTRNVTATDSTAALDKRIASLEAGAKDLAGRVADAKAAAVSAAAQADAARKQADVPGTGASIAAASPAGPDPTMQDALAKLGDRLAALETSAKAAPTAESLGEIRTGLQSLGATTDDRLKSNTAALGALQSTNASLEGRIKDVSDQLGRLPPALMLAGLRAVAAAQAGQDLRAGAPLRPALAALGRLGAPPATLEPLNAFADRGAPSAAALLADFKPLADRMAAEPAAADASFGDRLLHIADKIVTVRAVGDRTGNDLPGLIGRIQAALEGGNLPDAASAWDRLPEPARGVSSDWAKRLKARAAADGAAQRIAADALSALQAPSQ